MARQIHRDRSGGSKAFEGGKYTVFGGSREGGSGTWDLAHRKRGVGAGALLRCAPGRVLGDGSGALAACAVPTVAGFVDWFCRSVRAAWLRFLAQVLRCSPRAAFPCSCCCLRECSGHGCCGFLVLLDGCRHVVVAELQSGLHWQVATDALSE